MPAGGHPCPHCHGTGVAVDIDPLMVLAAIRAQVGELAFTISDLVEFCAVNEALEEALGALTVANCVASKQNSQTGARI